MMINNLYLESTNTPLSVTPRKSSVKLEINKQKKKEVELWNIQENEDYTIENRIILLQRWEGFHTKIPPVL